MRRLLIRNARVARPDGTLLDADVLCEGTRIARIDPAIRSAADETVEANGLVLLPGAIDPQVHFREPGNEHKEDLGSGSRAAVRGGVTSFLEMPNTAPPTTTQAALDEKLALAARKSVANYGFFIGATPDNLDAINTAHPACGIKIFMGASTGSLLVNREEDLERIFANGTRLIAVHAEDEARINERKALFAGRTDPATHSLVRDDECALRATRLALKLSSRYRRRLHILHLSTALEVELLRKDKPAWVTAEVIPNHLLLNTGHYETLGTLVQMNPPIRTPADNAALWAGLHDGIIDFLATDHAPHLLAEKQRGYPDAPSGMPGVETLVPLMLTQVADGRCTLAEAQRWLSAGPAQAYHLRRKGRLEEGFDADLALVDMDTRRPVRNEELFTRAGWSPYAGWNLTGWPQVTVVGGQVAFQDGKVRDGVLGRPLEYEPA